VLSLVGGGHQAACAIRTGGAVACWGDVGGAPSPAPVSISGLPAMLGLGAFDDAIVCGQAVDTSIWCFSIDGSSAPVEVQ
jgi:hypothetical protein